MPAQHPILRNPDFLPCERQGFSAVRVAAGIPGHAGHGHPGQLEGGSGDGGCPPPRCSTLEQKDDETGNLVTQAVVTGAPVLSGSIARCGCTFEQ